MKGLGFGGCKVCFDCEEQLTSDVEVTPKVKAKIIERYLIGVVSFLEVLLKGVILLVCQVTALGAGIKT